MSVGGAATEYNLYEGNNSSQVSGENNSFYVI